MINHFVLALKVSWDTVANKLVKTERQFWPLVEIGGASVIHAILAWVVTRYVMEWLVLIYKSFYSVVKLL